MKDTVSELSNNSDLFSQKESAKLYDKLSRLHFEMATVYAQLALQKPHLRDEEGTVPIKTKSGRLLANLKFTKNEAKVEIVTCLPTNNAPCSWLKNHLKSMEQRNEGLHFRFHEKDHALEFIEVEGKITSELARELESAISWAFNRMALDSVTVGESKTVQANPRTWMQERSSKEEKMSNG